MKRPTDEETLMLAIAFYCIMEPEKRAELLKLAEKYAMQSESHAKDDVPANRTSPS